MRITSIKLKRLVDFLINKMALDLINFSSLAIGFALPSLLTGISLLSIWSKEWNLRKGYYRISDEEMWTDQDEVWAKLKSKVKEELQSNEPIVVSTDDCVSQETQSILSCLSHRCNDLISLFPIDDQDQDEMKAIVEKIVSSHDFAKTIQSRDKSVENIAPLIMEVAASAFSRDEYEHIRHRADKIISRQQESSPLNPSWLLHELGCLQQPI